MDEWFAQMGNLYAALNGAPALAVDMALNGAPDEISNYALAASMIGTQAEIDLYPQEQEMNFGGMA